MSTRHCNDYINYNEKEKNGGTRHSIHPLIAFIVEFTQLHRGHFPLLSRMAVVRRNMMLISRVIPGTTLLENSDGSIVWLSSAHII
jgi:hypothetical protein